MNADNCNRVTSRMGSRDLQHVRRTLERELADAMAAGETGTQAHAGKLEMLAACGAELDRRGHLLPPPAFRDVCVEDGIRYPMQVRVF